MSVQEPDTWPFLPSFLPSSVDPHTGCAFSEHFGRSSTITLWVKEAARQVSRRNATFPVEGGSSVGREFGTGYHADGQD